ncbi:MAG: hydroxyethylthiazole kinase [Spirochaetes bacterium]|nr:hydroxyethylthiazole kinase [Spirochaetota bacterium]
MDTASLLSKVRNEKPLVHHITNWVTIYDCAALTRAFGALPVMAHAKEEAADMTNIAGALVLNMGTLTLDLVDAMLLAGKRANMNNIPVVFDAVGAGATPMRTAVAGNLMKEMRIDIIKGNVSEIAVMAGIQAKTNGVEAGAVNENHVDIARRLSIMTNSVVVITGKRDIIVRGKDSYGIDNGHELMGAVVGTGCTATSAIGCFAAVEKDYAKAAACALSCYGIAGELAALNAKGPASFKTAFYDAVYNLSADDVTKRVRIVSGL